MNLFVNAVSAKEGGGVTYIDRFLSYATCAEPDWEFSVFLPSATIRKMTPLPVNVQMESTEIGYSARWSRLCWDQISLRRRLLATKRRPVLFSTSNFGMLHCPVKQILLIQNALYFSSVFRNEYLPQYSFRHLTAFRLRRRLICQSVRSADIVMVPTQATLDEMKSFVDIPQSKVLINPFGQESIPPARAPNRLPAERPVQLLYVSCYFEHKNFGTLLRAIRELQAAHPGDFALTTTLDPGAGEGRWALTSGQDRALLADPTVRPAVNVVGLVSSEETAKLYGQADIFIFPSLTEAFGFPMVEAMARGLPIVASDTPVNREVCGEAAVYFPPFDFKALAREVQRVAQDCGFRETLRCAGLSRVQSQFRWEKHVKRFLDAASALAESPS